MKIEFDEGLLDRLQNNIQKEAEAMIGEIGTQMQAAVRGEISSAGLVDTGNYIRSVQLDLKRSGVGVMAVVGTNAFYALPLNYGIKKTFKPSKDMIDQITRWVERKLHLTGKEARKAAGAIAWNIGRKAASQGFPRRFGKDGAQSFEKGFAKVVKRVPSIVERFVRRASAQSESVK